MEQGFLTTKGQSLVDLDFMGNMKKIYIYAWNPNDPCFDWKRPSFGLKTKDKWVPGIHIYIYKHDD